MTRHKVLFSRYRSYFYHNERTTQASVILSYFFWIHDLIAGWGASGVCRVFIEGATFVVVKVPPSCSSIIEGASFVVLYIVCPNPVS